MTDNHARLALEDAMELAELLTFPHDWLADARARDVGPPRRADSSQPTATAQNEVRGDLARFAFLLGADDGTRCPGQAAVHSKSA
jgi:hypothetical protein